MTGMGGTPLQPFQVPSLPPFMPTNSFDLLRGQKSSINMGQLHPLGFGMQIPGLGLNRNPMASIDLGSRKTSKYNGQSNLPNSTNMSEIGKNSIDRFPENQS